MKRIGINQWAGIDPFLADTLSEFELKTTQSRKAEQERISRMPPSERFLMLAKQRFQKPRLYGIIPADDFFQIGDFTMIEIVKMDLDDVKDAGQFMIFLQSLYVVDAARGNGEGKRAIEQIKQISEETGCVIALFAQSFALSKEGYLPNAFQTFEELKNASLVEKWPVIYLPEWDRDCLRFFYKGCGFQNMCLYDAWIYKRSKEQDLPFDSQFAFVPSTLNKECRGQLENRLNRTLSDFCNRI